MFIQNVKNWFRKIIFHSVSEYEYRQKFSNDVKEKQEKYKSFEINADPVTKEMLSGLIQNLFEKNKHKIEQIPIRYSIGDTMSHTRPDTIKNNMIWAKISLYENPDTHTRREVNLSGLIIVVSDLTPRNKIELRYTGGEKSFYYTYEEIAPHIQIGFDKIFKPFQDKYLDGR
jgi:hypothetical protein